MHPDDVAYLQMASRTPIAPKWVGLMTCRRCHFQRMMVNTEGRCMTCQSEVEWAEDNRRMCNFIHRGELSDA